MKRAGLLGLCAAILVAGCAGPTAPRIAVTLPEKYNTPDGMVLGADDCIYLCVPNFNDPNYPPKVVKIHPDDTVTEVCTLGPVNPKTGILGALGIDIGPDGHLYIADNQGIPGRNDYQSRLLRVIMREGRAVRTEVLVTDFIQSNAVSCHGDSVWVTETSLDPNASPMPSGVYRFRYSEFQGTPLTLQRTGRDPHLVVTLQTDNPDWPVGANGMAFDAQGRLYVCNFGEASIERFTLDAQGRVTGREVFAQGQGMLSTDGLKICPDTGDLFVADFVGNAVHRIDGRTGRVTPLWRNANNSGGKGGLLDRPSEVCLRDGHVYVSNIDLPLQGNVYDAPHTISVIDLGE